MSGDEITCCEIQSHPVLLKPALKTYHLSGEIAERQHKILGCTLSYQLGSRELVRCPYDREEAYAILGSPIFDDPLRLALQANNSLGREKGLLRVALAAIPTTGEQESWLRSADEALPWGLGLRRMEGGLSGLSLGDLWFPGNPQVLKPIRHGPNFEEELDEFKSNIDFTVIHS